MTWWACCAQGCGPLEEPALAVVAFEILKFVKACHDLNILYGGWVGVNSMNTGHGSTMYCLKPFRMGM